MTVRRIGGLGAALVTCALLAACGSDGGGDEPTAAAPQADEVLAPVTQIDGAERTSFDKDRIRVEKLGTLPWDTQVTDESLKATLTSPRHLGFGELRSNIDYLERNNLDARTFRTAYWGRWFYPYKILVLCLAVIPFAFGSLRSGGFGKSLFVGIVVGIGALLLEQLAVNFAEIYRADVRIAYALAPLAVFALCWGFLAKRV